jgi:uncharacterized RDD family membrane protein YckC
MKEGSAWIEPHVGEETRQEPLAYPKANVFHRFIAKFIDLLIVAAIYELPLRVGFLAGLTYLLLADGFGGGRSPGKRLIGLQVVLTGSRRICSFKESIIRNFPLALAYLFFFVPFVGWMATVLLSAVEGLLIIGNGQGLRVGDELAGTQVLDNNVFHPSEE